MAICHRDNHSTDEDMYYGILQFNQLDSSATPTLQSPPPTHLQLLHFPQSSARRQAGHSMHRTPLFRRGDSISERSGTGRFGTFGRLVRRISSSSVHSSPPSSSTLISMPESAKVFTHSCHATLISAHHPLSPSSSLCSCFITGLLSPSPPSPLLNISFSRWYSLKISCTRNPEKTSSWNSSRLPKITRLLVPQSAGYTLTNNSPRHPNFRTSP